MAEDVRYIFMVFICLSVRTPVCLSLFQQFYISLTIIWLERPLQTKTEY